MVSFFVCSPPVFFVCSVRFLFAAILIFLQRVPCGPSYIWARVVRKYMRVCLAYVCMQWTHEKKWTPHWKKPTEQKRLQVYVAKKLHVYCVIIFKLMADLTKSAIRMVALHTLHAYKARVLGIERKSCFPMSLTSSSSSSSRDKNKFGGIWFMLQTKRFTVPSLYSDIYFCSERTTMTTQT